MHRRSLALCLGVLAACGGDNGNGPVGSGEGHITYSLSNGDQYRIEAKAGATPQNVSALLDGLSPGSDEWINLSPDGDWILLSSARFDARCNSLACLVLVQGDLSSGEAIQVAGDVVHATGFSAVASGGNVIVFEDAGATTHARDLWATSRTGGSWTTPIALTGASPYQFNSHPAVSSDGAKVLFDCGNQPFGGQGTEICEVATTGAGFRIAVRVSDSPLAKPAVGALHHAAYTSGGSIVFEADWAGVQIWRLAPGSTTPVRIAAPVTNDNSPCVLPDGRIASLWLSRAGNPQGLHELKVMTSNGSDYFMALTAVDVADIGLSCGA